MIRLNSEVILYRYGVTQSINNKSNSQLFFFALKTPLFLLTMCLYGMKDDTRRDPEGRKRISKNGKKGV